MFAALAAPQVVDLNAPEALTRLQAANPTHYEKVIAILAEIRSKPPEQVSKWLQVDFDARDAIYSRLLLVSFPPNSLLKNHRYRMASDS
jgi:hypothetical protein